MQGWTFHLSHLIPILIPSYSHLIPISFLSIDRQRFALLQIDRGLIVSISRWPRYVARAQMSMQKLLICHWSAISIRSPSPRQYKNYTFIVPTFERLWPAIQLFLHIWVFSPKLLPLGIKSSKYQKYHWTSITKDATTQQKKEQISKS